LLVFFSLIYGFSGNLNENEWTYNLTYISLCLKARLNNGVCVCVCVCVCVYVWAFNYFQPQLPYQFDKGGEAKWKTLS
jgi:hypothetical protein